jgi:hypothetical protein
MTRKYRESEFLVLPDGRLLAHNLTPSLAAALQPVAPGDPALIQRVKPGRKPRLKTTKKSRR